MEWTRRMTQVYLCLFLVFSKVLLLWCHPIFVNDVMEIRKSVKWKYPKQISVSQIFIQDPMTFLHFMVSLCSILRMYDVGRSLSISWRLANFVVMLSSHICLWWYCNKKIREMEILKTKFYIQDVHTGPQDPLPVHSITLLNTTNVWCR